MTYKDSKNKERCRVYYQKHKAELTAAMKKYRQENREMLMLAKRKYRREHPELVAIAMKKSYQKNREKRLAYRKQYVQKNKEARNIYQREKRNTDPQFQLALSLRVRLNAAIKNNQKVGSAVRDLGCTIPEFKFYIEGQFKDGMSWDNWGLVGDVWHIDHTIPLSFFDLTDREQFLKAVHYSNLAPMWAKENISKGAKVQV